MTTHSFFISRKEEGRALAAVLRPRLGLSWPQAQRLVRAGRVRLGGESCVDAARRVRRGQRLQVSAEPHAPHHPPRPQEQRPPAKPASSFGLNPSMIRHVDAYVLVVDKPAGLTTMRHPEDIAEFGSRARRFLPPTLADLLPELLARSRTRGPSEVRAVHRLDKETSGLVVFA